MKKLVIVFILLLCGCSRVLSFRETEEYIYINKNVSRIDKIVVKMDTLVDKNCYLINKEDGINMIEQIVIDSEAEYGVTDSDRYYLVYFNDGNVIEIKFSGEYLVYKDKNYILTKEQLFFVNKEGIPDGVDTDEYNVVVADRIIDCDK